MAISLTCGSCNLCCQVLAIPDLGKPARQWCEHAMRPHGGCAVHHLKNTDPKLEACAVFECLWLASQRRVNPTERLPISLRPNRCGVVMGPFDVEDNKKIYFNVDPEKPTAWREREISEQIETFQSKGGKVVVIVGERHIDL